MRMRIDRAAPGLTTGLEHVPRSQAVAGVTIRKMNYSSYQEPYHTAAGHSMFRRAGVAITVAIPTAPHHTEYPKTLRPRVPGRR